MQAPDFKPASLAQAIVYGEDGSRCCSTCAETMRECHHRRAGVLARPGQVGRAPVPEPHDVVSPAIFLVRFNGNRDFERRREATQRCKEGEAETEQIAVFLGSLYSQQPSTTWHTHRQPARPICVLDVHGGEQNGWNENVMAAYGSIAMRACAFHVPKTFI
jgi:hypothetical protein